MTFDFIHTSNLSDHLGLLNLLVSCGPRLKDHSSVLFTESFRWSAHHKTLEEFVIANVGCELMLLPSVLGLHLAENFDFGTTNYHSLPILKSSTPDTLSWVKNHAQSNLLVSLHDSPDLQKFLEQLVSNCCKDSVIDLIAKLDGSCMHTPLTLLHVLCGLQNRVVGGMQALLEFVDNQLNKNRLSIQHIVSWNAICWSFGFKDMPDELLVMQFKFEYQFPECGNPEAIGFSAPTSLLVMNFPPIQSLPISGFFDLLKYHQITDVISNFHFDQNNGTFTVSMLRSSFDRLSDQAIIALVLANEKGQKAMLCIKESAKILHTFSQEDTSLNRQSSAQPNISLPIVCKEFSEKYEFELKMNNQGKQMQCTSEFVALLKNELNMGLKIHVKYDLSENQDFSMIFSCLLDAERSKLSVSSKKGIISGVLFKDERNVGRYLLPLRLIDDSELQSFKDTAEIVNHLASRQINELMFQSVNDVELKFRSMQTGTKVVDPFFCLRETIYDIWKKVETNPRVTTFTYSYDNSYHPSGINGKIDLIIRGYHLYKGMPFLRVMYVDTEKALSLVGEHKLLFSEMREKRVEKMDDNPFTWDCDITKSMAAKITMEEHKLTKKLLLTNSRRIQQTHLHTEQGGWHWETFLQLLFDREARPMSEFNWQKLSEIISGAELIDQAISSRFKSIQYPICEMCGRKEKEATLKKCSRCKSLWYCSKECQRKNWSSHKLQCREPCANESTTNTNANNDAQNPYAAQFANLVEDVKTCEYCGIKKEKMIACATCHLSYYCNVQCRQKHSQSHKTLCKERKKWETAITRGGLVFT